MTLFSLSSFADEGFPRADIDVRAVRGARNRYAVLQTDYNRFMEAAELRLHAIFALRPASAEEADPVVEPASVPEEDAPLPPVVAASEALDPTAAPLGIVQGVAPDGPAYAAGLRSSMELLRFGSATAEAMAADGTGLEILSSIVGASAGQVIEVVARVPRGPPSLHRVHIPRPPRLGLHVIPVPSDKPRVER
jgi:hypothetical protein